MGVKTWRGRPFIIRLRGVNLRHAEMPGANFTDGDLSWSDATGADFRGANFERTNMKETVLIGADLRGAKNLTRAQLAEAIVDETTLLPEEILDHAAE